MNSSLTSYGTPLITSSTHLTASTMVILSSSENTGGPLFFKISSSDTTPTMR